MIEGKCEYCGKFFRRNRGKSHDAGRFCSRQCSVKFKQQERNKNHKVIQSEFLYLTCVFCGKKYFSIRKSNFCSEECRAKSYMEHARQYAKQHWIESYCDKTGICKHCGKEFQLEYKKSHVYCSDECKRKQANHRKKKRLKNRIIDSDISLAKLIERDNYICALCGNRIDTNDYSLDNDGNFTAGNNYPSIDHIVPLSLGGLHSWDNVQLAHFSCNRLKGAKIL